MNIVIIQKGPRLSVHTSFQKACNVYGWDREKLAKNKIPGNVGEFLVKKISVDTSIVCEELIELIENPNTKIQIRVEKDNIFYFIGPENHFVVHSTLITQRSKEYQIIEKIIDNQGLEVNIDFQFTNTLINTQLWTIYQKNLKTNI